MRNLLLLAVLGAPSIAHAGDAATDVKTRAATPALGPGASVADVCKNSLDGQGTDCPERALPVDLKPAAPYEQVGLADRFGMKTDETDLTLRVDGQWYVVPLMIALRTAPGVFALDSASIKDVIPGGSPELILTGYYDAIHSADGKGPGFGMKSRLLWVCGIGASAKPSCASIPIGATYQPPPKSGKKGWSFKVTFRFDKQGRLVRKLKGRWPKQVSARDEYVGTTELSFP